MTRPTVQLFGIPLNAWTMAETVQEIGDRIEAGRFTQHSVINTAKLVHMRRDPVLRASVTGCDIVSADGMGIVWAARLVGIPVPERVAGIDLFLELLELAEARGYPVYFLGARPEVVEQAVRNAQRARPGLRVTGYHHGYFWDDVPAIVDSIRASGARMLFVAISTPQKERFIAEWGQRLGVDFAMGVGGSFDVVAGTTRRAPRWMQRSGLEWAFRLAQEPRRLWRRYFTTNLAFAWLVAGEYLRRHRAR